MQRGGGVGGASDVNEAVSNQLTYVHGGDTHTQSQGKVKMPLQKLCALWQLMLFKAAVCDNRLER